MEQRVPPASQRRLRWLLRRGSPAPPVCPGAAAGPGVRPLLPPRPCADAFRPARTAAPRPPGAAPAHPVAAGRLRATGRHPPPPTRRPGGCSPGSASPCTRRRGGLLRRGELPPGGPTDGLDDMRRNIDAWWPQIEAGAEYHRHQRHRLRQYAARLRPPAGAIRPYADKARRVSALARDIGEILLPEDYRPARHRPRRRPGGGANALQPAARYETAEPDQ